jgi:hypothetical protein
MAVRTVAIAVVLWLATSARATACSVVGPLPTPEELVERASTIVRVVALSYSTQNDLTSNNLLVQGQPISFQIIETLKGHAEGSTLWVIGWLENKDDFNEGPIPYRTNRPGGHAGCYAVGYRAGASYLLLLGHQQGVLTPYWAPSSPVNEQLRSDDDPWLLWVRRRLAGAR